MEPVPFYSAAKWRALFFMAIFLQASAFGFGQDNHGASGSWSGTIVSSACNADEAFNESPECMKSVPGAKLTLYDDTNRVMYGLEPQSAVKGGTGRSGHHSRNARWRVHSGDFAGGDDDWTCGRPEGSGVFFARPVWPSADSGNTERSERNGCSSFSVPLIGDRSAKGSWSSCKMQTAIRKARALSWLPSAMTPKRF